MTPEQRHQALELANEVRYQMAQVKAVIRASGPRGGALRAIEIIDAAESRIRFFGLLRSVPRISESGARRMLAWAQINPEAHVNDPMITRRQRKRLIGYLVAHAHGDGWR